ncbi:uncharacterized protein [Spinacia oleracea]|uniref:Reverse transcriptase domain-containing protein n=1 Tax=Spinacia oleracea TaxID=3562 RepID=A0A9R0JDG9_SPIOL|nr:uncharacterized protein LOC110803305 [Spinacia oleracea]
MFVYGEPRVEEREHVWSLLSFLLDHNPNCILIGDFNQLETLEDKLGGSPMIRGTNSFIDWRIRNNVYEIPFSGPRYTWTNKCLGESLILERLDWGYVTSLWFDEFPEGRIRNEPITVSDHAAICYESSPSILTRRRPYQIENWCLKLTEIQDLVKRSWAPSGQGSCMFLVSSNLRVIRNGLQDWCLTKRKLWGINWKEANKELLQQVNDNMNLDQGNRYVEKINEWIPICRLQFEYWQQRMKERWIKEGDCNSQIMYRTVKQRKSRNEIITLKNEHDEWIEGQSQVSKVIMNSLEDIFNPPNANQQRENIDLTLRQLDLPKITASCLEELNKPFTMKEIRDAMFHIHVSKSPGPDGFSAEFFKTYWNTVGGLVTKSITRFFETGYLLKEWNQSLLVMIPKIPNPELASHFRPISLCNTIYKCISKCLVNRMKGVLPEVISNFQHAFIPGRYMEDNILLSHELINMVNTRKSKPMAVVKLDISKAYDRVNWTFLLKVLQAYGFPSKWVQMISQCITTVSYKAVINGKTTDTFVPQCGLRQGDPLSPYLFLFCMDILSRMMSLAEDIKLIKGLKVTRRSPSITHLFFADDAMLFFKANVEACENIMEILERVGTISGQKLNLNKSYVKFSPFMRDADKESLKAILSMPSTNKMGTHLGVPVDIQGKKSVHFQFLVDVIARKILSWAGLHLSPPSKLILIQTVLLSISSHVMRCLKVPLSIANKIDSLISKFWWAGGKESAMHWVKRDITNRPKSMGGLGIRSSQLLNDTVLFKQAMRLHNNKQLLVAKVIFSSHGCCVCGKGLISSIAPRGSMGKKGFYRATRIFKMGLGWKVGSGKGLKASKEAWVNGKVPEARSDRSLAEVRGWKVEDFINQADRKWKSEDVRRCFVWKDAKQILGMELPKDPTDDFLYWINDPKGKFTVKSGYAWLVDKKMEAKDRLVEEDISFLKLIWRLPILPKWKTFLWKLTYNGIAVNANLFHRGIEISPECDYCGHGEEDTQHLFRYYTVARLAWSVSQLQVQLVMDESIGFKKWIQKHILLFYSKDGKGSLALAFFVAMLWSLWTTRNARVFRGIGGHTRMVLQQANMGMQQLEIFKKRPCQSEEEVSNLPQIPPGFLLVQLGFSKTSFANFVLQVDGSWDKKTMKSGYGWTYNQQDNSQCQDGGGDYGCTKSAIQAEAQACLQGLKWPKRENIDKIKILTDCATLITCLQSKTSLEIQIHWITEEIKRIAKEFNICTIVKADRTAVLRAHQIANSCRKDGISFSTRL